MVASLVVFLPGAALTTAVLELAAGQMISGASRLVSGSVQLALLAFGILAGIEAVGVSDRVLFGTGALLGEWSPWIGVLVFAIGVMVADSAPARSFPACSSCCTQRGPARCWQRTVRRLHQRARRRHRHDPGGVWVERFAGSMPAHASFLPGFWLLVPGSLGLIGLTRLASGGGNAETSSRPLARSSPWHSASFAVPNSWPGLLRPAGSSTKSPERSSSAARG